MGRKITKQNWKRQDAISREKQQKINAALAKKPTSAFLKRNGLTLEQIKNSNEGISSRKALEGRVISSRKKRNQRKGGLQRGQQPLRRPVRFPFKQNLTNPCSRVVNTPKWFTSTEEVDVSIIVPMFKSENVIREQIRNWDLTTKNDLTREIIYVDDCCPNGSHSVVLSEWTKIKNKLKAPVGKIISNRNNSGYGPACNVGASYSLGKYLIFLNADCRVTPNWVKPMIELLESDPEIGIVGNLQIGRKGNVESAGSEWSWKGKSFKHIGKNIYHGREISPFNEINMPTDLLEPEEREMVTGCCFAMPKALFMDLGGFDEEFRIGYWEDSDLNMRVRTSGYKVYFQPKSKIYHKPGHSGAGGHPFMANNQKLFASKWIHTGRLDTLVKDERPNGKKECDFKDNIDGKVVGCVICCNEEEFLEASVKSASSIVDNWVFVVGGNEYAYKAGMCDKKGYPKDSTLDIATSLAGKYDGTVIKPPGRLWKDKVEMRNAYVPHLKSGDWMFMLDGDEVYKENQLWRVAELMQSYEVLIMQFWVFWNNINTVGTGTWESCPQERVVRWEKGYGYRGRNHLHVTNARNELVCTTRPCWKGGEKLFYHYSWIRPLEKIKQKREYYKYQSNNRNENYLQEVYLKWRENPDEITQTHPMGGGGAKPFFGIHPESVQELIKAGKLDF
jgi:GT2 family glycosyltransferase